MPGQMKLMQDGLDMMNAMPAGGMGAMHGGDMGAMHVEWDVSRNACGTCPHEGWKVAGMQADCPG